MLNTHYNKPKKQNENERFAQGAMLAGVVVTLIALIVVPLTWPESSRPGWWLTYNANTGVIGDTIGGIAGPVLNFAGLLVVYYSLREQIKTNNYQFEQFSRENDQNRNERAFELAFKIVERFSDAVEGQRLLFTEVVTTNRLVDSGRAVISSVSMGGYRAEGTDVLNDFERQLNTLIQFFETVARRLEGEALTGEQKLVLIDLIEVGYGAKLRFAIADYQSSYGMGKLEQQPKPLYQLMEGQDIAIYKLRQAAENQAAFERIPFGDAEAA